MLKGMQSLAVCSRIISRVLYQSLCTGAASSNGDSTKGIRRNDLGFLTSICGLPKERKYFIPQLAQRGQFGDDACFTAKYKTCDVLGVADGVGGWRSYGIDPSKFSRALMFNCEQIVQSGRFNQSSAISVLRAAYYEMEQSKEHVIGSTTACVLLLSGGMLHSANIGDSGFLVLRSGCIVHKSSEQQHYFNTPFQLCIPPPEVSQYVLADSVESADTASFPVEEGDLILLATDGLFDNISESMIVKELRQLTENPEQTALQRTVNSLALQARCFASSTKHMSPFSQRARENGIEAVGGKPDDITILLASVTKLNSGMAETEAHIARASIPIPG